MLVTIQPIGGFFETDNDGYIINPCHQNLITGKWTEPVDAVVAYYKKTHKESLLSVYLRGSVPKGTMVENISDIDSFCLTSTEISNENQASIEKYQSEFAAKYQFINGVEIESNYSKSALQSKYMRFLLKTQCLCIAGADVTNDIDPMMISAENLNTCPFLTVVNDDFLQQADASPSVTDALDLCSWIFKFALRAAFEIVILRENKFTRDIYYCWSSYSKYYPENSDILKQALYFVVNPTGDIQEIKFLWKKIFTVLQKSFDNNEHLLK